MKILKLRFKLQKKSNFKISEERKKKNCTLVLKEHAFVQK
jgi:hypothetical protein